MIPLTMNIETTNLWFFVFTTQETPDIDVQYSLIYNNYLLLFHYWVGKTSAEF